jgi:hypothetical protein
VQLTHLPVDSRPDLQDQNESTGGCGNHFFGSGRLHKETRETLSLQESESIEHIFPHVYPLSPYFERLQNQTFLCKKKVMIRNIKLISLINTNQREEQDWRSSVLLIEKEMIFEILIQRSDDVFVLKENNDSESQTFFG